VAPIALAAQSGYVPERVFHSSRAAFSDFEAMLADVATADVVFLGEQHDDPNTHRLELAVLEGLARRRSFVILSLEMFERDVQESLDHYAEGHLPEADFLAASRPWPRYQTDYRPLVEFAIEKDWIVVAANVPRPLASAVAKSGWTALEPLDASARAHIAADRECPTGDDPYFQRFMKAMGAHPGATTDQYYFAQCLKDETMAESIARAYADSTTGAEKPLVVHVNGAFHSDYGLGTAERVRRRMLGKRTVVISIQPVDNLDTLAPTADDVTRGDYLLFTVKKTSSSN
jgi:uncharacterized iron-regulated protein